MSEITLDIFCPKCGAPHMLSYGSNEGAALEAILECEECKHSFTIMDSYDYKNATSKSRHSEASMTFIRREYANALKMQKEYEDDYGYKSDSIGAKIEKFGAELADRKIAYENRRAYLISLNTKTFEQYEATKEALRYSIDELKAQRLECMTAYKEIAKIDEIFLSNKEREAKSTLYNETLRIVGKMNVLDSLSNEDIDRMNGFIKWYEGL